MELGLVVAVEVLVHVAIDGVALADLLDDSCSTVAGSTDKGGFLLGGGVGGVSCRSIPS